MSDEKDRKPETDLVIDPMKVKDDTKFEGSISKVEGPNDIKPDDPHNLDVRRVGWKFPDGRVHPGFLGFAQVKNWDPLLAEHQQRITNYSRTGPTVEGFKVTYTLDCCNCEAGTNSGNQILRCFACGHTPCDKCRLGQLDNMSELVPPAEALPLNDVRPITSVAEYAAYREESGDYKKEESLLAGRDYGPGAEQNKGLLHLHDSGFRQNIDNLLVGMTFSADQALQLLERIILSVPPEQEKEFITKLTGKLYEGTVLRKIDNKFGTDGRRIFNLISQEEIPEDEPLFLLRARDSNATGGLRGYQVACEDSRCNELHLAGIQKVIKQFREFRDAHPDRMKEPGITRHLKL